MVNVCVYMNTCIYTYIYFFYMCIYTLSIYWGIWVNSKMHLQTVSGFWDFNRAFSQNSPNRFPPQPPRFVAEKRRLRALGIRHSSPRNVMVPLQRVSFTDFDLPEMHFVPWRAFEASHWTGMHLGGVKIGKTHPLSRHS